MGGYGQTGYWAQWEPEIGQDIDCPIRLTSSYAVFINKQLEVDWATTQKFDEETGEDHWRLINMVVGSGDVIDRSIALDLDIYHKRAIREFIAMAISLALENCEQDAHNKLADARNYATLRNAELARKWIFIYTLQFLLAFFVLLAVYAFYASRPASEIEFSVTACAGGAVGAALSLIMRTTKLELDIHAGKMMFYLEILSRLFVGGISGFFVYIALKLGILGVELAVRNAETLGGYGLPLIIGLISGSTERWFKSLIEKSPPESPA